MEKWFRIALFATGIINIFGGLTFVPFIRFARDMFKFPDAHPVYLWIFSVWIFAFGVCYLWLAAKQRREWLFVVIAAVGKLSFFSMFAIYWLIGELHFLAAAGVSGDLIFGGLFAFWAFKHRNDLA
jgi:hypothetical protein